MSLIRPLATLGSALLLASILGAGVARAQPRLPNPILFLIGQEYFSANGQNFVRYRYDVLNKSAYPAELFAPAPGLPPCGSNANAARAWVDIFDQRGRRLYGFCALESPNGLGQIWFELPEGQIPPSYVYIEINDRQTSTKYRSNLADTVP